jgi:uncharacterized protein
MRHSDLGISVRKTVMGRGVFATQKFRKNQVIGRMHGTVIPGEDYDPNYVVDLGKWGVLDPHAPFRYMNHCCSPNAALIEYASETPKTAPTMWVEALRTIQVGEQISIDYSWPLDAAIPCLCGDANCRGWVVSEVDAKKLKRLAAKQAAASTPTSKKTAKKRKAAVDVASKAAKKQPTLETAKKAAKQKANPGKPARKSSAKRP